METEVFPIRPVQLSEKSIPQPNEIHALLTDIWQAALQSRSPSENTGTSTDTIPHKYAGASPLPARALALRNVLSGNPLAPYRHLRETAETPQIAESDSRRPTMHIFAEIGFLSELNPVYRDRLAALAEWMPDRGDITIVMHPIDNTLTTTAIRAPLPPIHFTADMSVQERLTAVGHLLTQAKSTQPQYHVAPEKLYTMRIQSWDVDLATQMNGIYTAGTETPVCVLMRESLSMPQGLILPESPIRIGEDSIPFVHMRVLNRTDNECSLSAFNPKK